MTGNTIKDERLQWLCRIYSGDRDAVAETLAQEHLLDHSIDFGLKDFVDTYRPLKKLRDARGDLTFTLIDIDHREADRTYAKLVVDEEVIFDLIVRFEEQAPYRVKYWMSHPPLPVGIEIRPYQSDDAQGCVALEAVCPMEQLDGSKWTVDRGVYFDDYLQLMESVDAAVAVEGDNVIGFYSCALRPIRYQDTDNYCIYQHHYRVHPNFRAGSVSQALATYVDPRRTFEGYEAHFPYSMVDPNNAHMQFVGFPAVEDVRIARLSIALNDSAPEVSMRQPGVEEICDRINQSHGSRSLFRPYTPEALAARTSKIESYSLKQFVGNDGAVLGIWDVNERNVLQQEGKKTESKLAFVLDYGFTDVNSLAQLIDDVAPSLRKRGATHLCFLCDQRAAEYEMLQKIAADEQLLAIHTLPWTVDAFAEGTVYCDAVYC